MAHWQWRAHTPPRTGPVPQGAVLMRRSTSTATAPVRLQTLDGGNASYAPQNCTTRPAAPTMQKTHQNDVAHGSYAAVAQPGVVDAHSTPGVPSSLTSSQMGLSSTTHGLSCKIVAPVRCASPPASLSAPVQGNLGISTPLQGGRGDLTPSKPVRVIPPATTVEGEKSMPTPTRAAVSPMERTPTRQSSRAEASTCRAERLSEPQSWAVGRCSPVRRDFVGMPGISSVPNSLGNSIAVTPAVPSLTPATVYRCISRSASSSVPPQEAHLSASPSRGAPPTAVGSVPVPVPVQVQQSSEAGHHEAAPPPMRMTTDPRYWGRVSGGLPGHHDERLGMSMQSDLNNALAEMHNLRVENSVLRTQKETREVAHARLQSENEELWEQFAVTSWECLASVAYQTAWAIQLQLRQLCQV